MFKSCQTSIQFIFIITDQVAKPIVKHSLTINTQLHTDL